MTRRIIVTGGAIIRDHAGRILLQRRSDYGDWGQPVFIDLMQGEATLLRH